MAEAKQTVNYLILPIDGMTCASCAARVKQSINALSDVDTVDVNLAAEQAAIGFYGTAPTPQELKATIEQAGYRIRSRTTEALVPGFNDATRAQAIESAVLKIMGVESCSVNVGSENISIGYIPGIADIRTIIDTISRETGVKVIWQDSGNQIDAEHEKIIDRRIKQQFRHAIISITLAVVVFILTMHHFFPGVKSIPQNIRYGLAFLLSSWVVFVAGAEMFKRFFYKLMPGKSDMNTLVSLGSSIALGYSSFIWIAGMISPESYGAYPVFFDSATFIIGFILLGRSLEARARKQTGQALRSLSALQPEQAHLEQNGSVNDVPIGQLAAGNTCRIKNGEHIPADGVLLSDNAEVDEAMLSGESVPVEKKRGALLLSGTVNAGSEIRMQVQKTGDDTALGQIVRWVKQAQNSQPPVQKLVDKIASIFVPVVLVLATITLFIWLISGAETELAVMHFINVIVIACPCALGLATPTAIVVAMGRSAAKGTLIKGAETLEKLLKIDMVLFDKTGTLTKGKLSLQKIIVLQNNEDELLELASALERHSTHPIAKAIIDATNKRGLQIPTVEKADMMAGFGIRATVDGTALAVGNRKLIQAMGIAFDEKIQENVDLLAAQGMTPVFIVRAKQLLGILGLADTVRPEAVQVITKLKKMGVKTAMVTGDAQLTAEAVAKSLQIDKVYAEQPPQVKAKVVKALQDENSGVLMVGDGVNDAVALSQADIGVALAEGTDVAIDAADIVLLHPDLELLLSVKKLARKTERIIKQNLFWAFGYNVLLIPVAAGLLHVLWGINFNPAFAAMAMASSSVTVVSNSLRLRRE